MINEARWRKSSRSGSNSDCVELSQHGAIRDSKNPAGGVLVLDAHTAAEFLRAVKTGQFDS